MSLLLGGSAATNASGGTGVSKETFIFAIEQGDTLRLDKYSAPTGRVVRIRRGIQGWRPRIRILRPVLPRACRRRIHRSLDRLPYNTGVPPIRNRLGINVYDPLARGYHHRYFRFLPCHTLRGGAQRHLANRPAKGGCMRFECGGYHGTPR